MSSIFTIGTFIAYFIAILFFTKKERVLADLIIGIWMCVIGSHLLAVHLNYLGLWEVYPHLFGTTAIFPLLHAPFLYLYISYFLNGKQQFHLKDLLHFLPAGLSSLYVFRIIFFYTAEEKMSLDNGQIDESWFISSVLFVLIVSAVVYVILSFRKLKHYQKIVQSNFSHSENVNMKWLQYWIMGIAGVFCVVAVVIILRQGFGLKLGKNIDAIFYCLFILLIVVLGYFGINHHGIFTTKNILVKKQVESYSNSNIDDKEAERIQKELDQLMLTKKPYLNPKLTLTNLAKSIDTSPNQLSEVINQYQKVNFYKYVNDYRIQEFKYQAAKNPEYSILALAYDSGFNSKSSFNNIFKRETGMTPSEYLKSTT